MENLKKTSSLNAKLIKIQTELKAPKNQFNKFGNYSYRSCEDILEALKPLLSKYNCTLVLFDEIVNIVDRYYVKAVAKLIDIDSSEFIGVTAFAREELEKKGMDGSQITGASSSYARKYALNGLFLIDDTKDSDYTNEHGKVSEKVEKKPELAKVPEDDEKVKEAQEYAMLAKLKAKVKAGEQVDWVKADEFFKKSKYSSMYEYVKMQAVGEKKEQKEQTDNKDNKKVVEKIF